MSFCKNCGEKIADDAVFCTSCGVSIGQNTSPAMQAPLPPPPSSFLSPTKRKGNKLAGCFVILLLIIGLCYALVKMGYISVNVTSSGFDFATTASAFTPVVSKTTIPTSPTITSSIGSKDQGLLMNSKYGFSLNLGTVATNIDRVMEVLTPDTDAYYVYCYILQPGDATLQFEDYCSSKNIAGIFTLEVQTDAQLKEWKAAGGESWGQVLASQNGKNFVYSHMNGEQPKSLPVGLFESVAKSFTFTDTVKTDGPPTKNTGEAADILTSLSLLSGISFTDLEPTTFSWWSGTWEKMIETKVAGYVIRARSVPDTQSFDLEKFFMDEKLVIDDINIADGTVQGRTGYKRGKLVCQLYTGFTGGEEAFDKYKDGDPTFSDIDVQCGVLPS